MVVQAQTCQALRLNIAGFTGKTKFFPCNSLLSGVYYSGMTGVPLDARHETAPQSS